MSIRVEKNIFLVPYWLVNTVVRNNFTIDTILNLEKLIDVTSPEDLALTSLLNERSEKVFGIGSFATSLYDNWYKNSFGWSKFESQIKPLTPLVQDDLDARLFNESSKTEIYPVPFEIKDVNQNTFLVIIYPGFFSEDDAKKHRFELTSSLLKLFYVYEGYDNMARRQLFECYINQL